MRFKRIGIYVLLGIILLSSTISIAGETKKKEILTKEEVQAVVVNTITAIKVSKLDRAFVRDKEHTYQFLKCLEFAIYQLKKNKNLTRNCLYSYVMVFVDKLYSLTGDCHLYYATQDFLVVLEFKKILSYKDNKIHVRTRVIALVTLLILQKVLNEVACQNSI